MTPLARIRLEGDAERVRQSTYQAIGELQRGEAVEARVISNIDVPGTAVAGGPIIPHGLGRPPRFVGISAIRVRPADLASMTSGTVMESGTTTFTGGVLNRSESIQIGAFGFTVPIIVDLLVM